MKLPHAIPILTYTRTNSTKNVSHFHIYFKPANYSANLYLCTFQWLKNYFELNKKLYGRDGGKAFERMGEKTSSMRN